MRIIKIPKKNGRFRLIYVPDAEEKVALRRVLPKIVDMVREHAVPGVIHGFMPGRSPVTNALQHVGYQFTLGMDLKDFFDTVTPEMAPQVPLTTDEIDHRSNKMTLHSYRVPSDVTTQEHLTDKLGITTFDEDVVGGQVFLKFVCPNEIGILSTYKIGIHEVPRCVRVDLFPDGAARQGLPTSPAIANLAAISLDREIDKWMRSKGRFSYTRYADDLSLSSNDHGHIVEAREFIAETASSLGFIVNERKTRLQTATAGRRIITGVGVDKDQIYPTRKIKRKLRAARHQGNVRSAGGLYEVTKLREPRGWQQDLARGAGFWGEMWDSFRDLQ